MLVIVESELEKAFAAGGDARKYREMYLNKQFDTMFETIQDSTEV